MAGVSMTVAPAPHGDRPLDIPHGSLPGILPRLQGFALRLVGLDQEAQDFEIAGIAPDGTVALVLGPFPEEEVVAVWRSLAARSGLPLLLQHPDGELQAPYPQVGAVQLGAIRIRRRHGLLNGRRPRFLVRRKTGRPASRPLVHREREIAGGGRG